MRIRSRRSAALLLGLGLALVPLSGCGKDKKAADTTVAATETTVAAESGSAETTVAAAPTESVAAGESGSTETTAAAAESDGAETTVAGAAAGAETTVAANTAGDAAAAGGEDQLAAALGLLGVTDPKELACIKDSGASATDLASGAPSAKFMRALLKCSPSALSGQAAKSFKEAVPNATDEQAKCVADIAFKKIGELSDEDLQTALGGDLPADLKADVKKDAKSCGLSDADLDKALNS